MTVANDPDLDTVADAFVVESRPAWEALFGKGTNWASWKHVGSLSPGLPLGPATMHAWSQRFDSSKATAWVIAGFTLAQALRWRPTGFTPDMVVKLGWVALDPEDTWRPWQRNGIARHDVADWINVGVTDPADAGLLTRAPHLTAPSFEAYRKAERRPALIALLYLPNPANPSATWTVADVVAQVRTHRALPPVPVDDDDLADLGLVAAAFAPDSDQAWEWAFPNPESRTVWRDAVPDLSALQAKEWATQTMAPVARRWVDAGATVEDAARWHSHEIGRDLAASDVIDLGWAASDPETVLRPWLNDGFRLGDVGYWKRIGVHDPGDATLLKNVPGPVGQHATSLVRSRTARLEVEYLDRGVTIGQIIRYARTNQRLPPKPDV